MHRSLVRGAVIALAVFGAARAYGREGADNYPTRPVRWVVPFTPGASNDIIARLVGPEAGRSVGAAVRHRQPSGGRRLRRARKPWRRRIPTATRCCSRIPGPSVNTPLMLKRPLYKVEDFTNIVFIGYAPLIILANPKFPANNPKELLAYAKSNPGKVSWGSSGNGSSLHIGLALFQAATGADVDARALQRLGAGDRRHRERTDQRHAHDDRQCGSADQGGAREGRRHRECEAQPAPSRCAHARRIGHQGRRGDRLVRHVGTAEARRARSSRS